MRWSCHTYTDVMHWVYIWCFNLKKVWKTYPPGDEIAAARTGEDANCSCSWWVSEGEFSRARAPKGRTKAMAKRQRRLRENG